MVRWWKRKRLPAEVLLFCLMAPSLPAGWKGLAEGVEYQKIVRGGKPDGEIRAHLFRVDPSHHRLGLLIASDQETSQQSSKLFREQSGAWLAINGGFFDEAYRSLGLLMRDGKVVNPLRNAGWGIFQIKEGLPSIIHRSDWSPEGVTLALQVGPRLVVNGRAPSFKPESERHRRSAVGVTSDGKILIALCETPIGIEEWAKLLSREAPNVLNLDGGGSSQISVRTRGLSLEIPGITAVPNAVGVFAK